MNFSRPSDFLQSATSLFTIERNGQAIGTSRGFFCGKGYPNTIQLIENADVQGSDWLIHPQTQHRYFIKNTVPLSMHGEVCGWMLEYESETEHQRNMQPSSEIHIGTINGPSIIGSQQNATFNIGPSIEDIVQLIASKPPADQVSLCELVAVLKSIESSDTPVEKGRLSKFSDLIKKHSDLLVALGGWAVKLLTGE